MLCCNTTISKIQDPETKEEKWEPKGNSSEAPIIVAGRKLGFTTDELDAGYKRVLEVPFSSARKMMLTVTEVSGRSELCKGGLKLPAGSKYITVCKGAPNYILEACKGYVSESGDELLMTEAAKKDLYAVI